MDLVRIANVRAAVTCITDFITVTINLINIRNLLTVVLVVSDA